MNKISVLTFLISVFSTTVFGQAFDFSYQTVKSYKDLTQPNILNVEGTWDDPQYSVPIGFDFELFGVSMDTIFLEDYFYGAWLTTSLDEEGELPVIIVYGPDLVDRGAIHDITESEISHQTEGSTGSRIFKMQWKNFGYFSELSETDTCLDFGNVQLWLYEGSNIVEMHFGPESVKSPQYAFEFEDGPFLGIIEKFDFNLDNPTKGVYSIKGNPVSPTLDVSEDEIAFLNDAIPEGMIYQFKPKSSSIAIKTQNTSIKVYPNPSEDLIQVEGFEGTLIKAEVIDMTGKLIKTEKESSFSIQDLSEGIYQIRCLTSQGTGYASFAVTR